VKLLIFAHKPPPHHGQSYMVELMIDGFGGDHRDPARRKAAASAEDQSIASYHVDARLSRGINDIGQPRWGKVFSTLRYSLEAVWCRFRYGVRNFYYVPAPGQRVPLYRDWIVMMICRPFFRRIIFHTHAVGLGTWLDEKARPWERTISRCLLGGVDLNIVLSEYYRADVMKLSPRRVEVVPIGIPDPCPDFQETLLSRRLARVALRRKLIGGQEITTEERANAGEDLNVFRVLFVSLCFREKGLFDVVEAVAQLHEKLTREKSEIQVRFDVVGKFFIETERAEFERRISQPDLQAEGEPVVKYHGFVDTQTKFRLLRQSDCFAFPTYYQVEGQPASLVEAMAFGLPVVTTRWRALPELFAKDYPGLVDIQSPGQIAAALEMLFRNYPAANFREEFLNRFTEGIYIKNLGASLRAALLEK
jgi:glycosyltransferase involved in cell wall biosynthesis